MMGALEIFPGMPPARASLIAVRLLRLHSPAEIAQAVEILLDVLNQLEPAEDEPDFRPVSDGLPGDPDDTDLGADDEPGAYAEWTSMPPATRKAGTCMVDGCGHEDDEAAGDEQDMSWPNRIRQDRIGPNMGTEDDKDDDPDTSVEDGRFDPEDDGCEAADDGCGPFARHGAVHWGSYHDEGIELMVPRYGADQSLGPLPPK